MKVDLYKQSKSIKIEIKDYSINIAIGNYTDKTIDTYTVKSLNKYVIQSRFFGYVL